MLSSSAATFRRGEVWYARHGSTVGHEQRGDRPCLIVSADLFNAGPSSLVVACPMTTRRRGWRWHVEVEPGGAGLTPGGFIMSEQVRAMSKERFRRRAGRVDADVLAEVERRLRVLMVL